MLRYLVDPIFQVINTAGKPATGGYIEVYVHGTGDKYYCASDFDGTLHPFKIPLDSLGSNIILADDANAYDIYAYNRYGSLLMSRYNIAVSNSGGGGNASRKGTIHKLGLWAVDAADAPPKPQTDWIIDLESPNADEPSGYDRLTVEKAREIHNSGSFFGLRTEHVQNPYEDNLLLETYFEYVSMSQTFEVKLAKSQDANKLSEYTLGNFGNYVGVYYYWNVELLPLDGDGSDVTASFTEAQTRTNITTGSKLSVLFGAIKKWFSDLKALAFKDKASLTQDVSDILRIENGGTGAGTVVGARSNLDVYSKSEVESLLAGRIVFVTVLPATGEAGKIYYLEVDTNVYDTYIWGYAPGATEESWILTGRQELNLDDYKKKQQPYSKMGSKTKTITAISQDANGKIDATFEDIEIPESVPRVNIVSSGGTISVSSSENVQTNTKTFDINVNQKPLSVAWLESSLVEYNGSNHTFTAKRFTLINNGQQNPQGDKITLTDSKLYLKAGTYHVDSRVIINWTGEPQNRVIMIDGIPFDLSYNHSETLCNTSVIAVSSTVLQYFSITGDESITGLSVSINAIAIYAIEQVMENVVQGLDSVATDDTLTGDGTTGNPLSVAVDNALDADSENPVQNKVLYAVIGNVESLLENL